MAISALSFVSLTSPNSIFSSSSSLSPVKLNHHRLSKGKQSSNGRLVIHCSSEMGPTSDPINLRQPQMSSVAPFGVTMNEQSYRWRRVLLKVSGEALAGDQMQNIDPKVTMAIAREVATVTRLGIETKKKRQISQNTNPLKKKSKRQVIFNQVAPLIACLPCTNARLGGANSIASGKQRRLGLASPPALKRAPERFLTTAGRRS